MTGTWYMDYHAVIERQEMIKGMLVEETREHWKYGECVNTRAVTQVY